MAELLLDSLGRRNRKRPNRQCNICGKTYHPRIDESKYCSRACQSEGFKSKKGWNRKEGPIWWNNKRGYIEGRIWVNGKRVKVQQHRWTMEQHLGRELLPSEDVHHINGSKTDNRTENLMVLDHAEHTRLSNARTHCKRGHPLAGNNLYVRKDKRDCRECTRIRQRERYARKKQEATKP